MKYPRAFRNTILAHFEKTKKKVWTREEVAMKILELWWDLPKKTAPVTKKRPRKSKAPRATGIPLGPDPDDVPELAGDA